jgi:hypothetical protein
MITVRGLSNCFIQIFMKTIHEILFWVPHLYSGSFTLQQEKETVGCIATGMGGLKLINGYRRR